MGLEDKGRRDIKGSVACLHHNLLAHPCWWTIKLSPLPFSPLTEAASQHPHAQLSLEGSRAKAFQVEETIQAKAVASPALSLAQAGVWAATVGARDPSPPPERCGLDADFEMLVGSCSPIPHLLPSCFLIWPCSVPSPPLCRLVPSCSQLLELPLYSGPSLSAR